MPAALGSGADVAAMRLSVPTRGHVLSTAAESYGKPIREAVQIIANGLAREQIELPDWLERSPHPTDGQMLVRSVRDMVARHICTQWVIGVVLKALVPTDNLDRAVSWFAGNSERSFAPVLSRIGTHFKERAFAHLSSAADASAWAELLPYVLDPHGLGTRLSVMRDPSTRSTRDRKRSNGSFYTPADVAEYMLKAALENFGGETISILDPACGTGVYLRASLSELRRIRPNTQPAVLVEHLYGIDIDPWAVHAAAYVLVHDVIAANSDAEPVQLWKRVRRNLYVGDALRLDPAGCDLPDANPITRVFPALETGASLIAGNPPYTQLGDRPDILKLATRFQTLRPVSAKADIHPLFVEQTTRLAAPDAAAALVLPLSIGFNTRSQFIATRRLIERTPGTWSFSFFDREPHALFGEDVKTRNTVLVWKRHRTIDKCTVMTGPLLKWRGQSRARMFKSIRHTPISSSIVPGVPKLGSTIEADGLRVLFERSHRFGESVLNFGSCGLRETFTAGEKTIFVASTAYNFLNVFFQPPGYLKAVGNLSENSVHAIDFEIDEDALLAYTLLSSRTAFWLWHVLGDGFHVTQTNVESLPLSLSAFDAEARAELVSLGSAMWTEAKGQPLTSYNRGRTSLAFPNYDPALQRAVDVRIAAASNLPPGFVEALDTIVESVITAEPLGRLQANEDVSP